MRFYKFTTEQLLVLLTVHSYITRHCMSWSQVSSCYNLHYKQPLFCLPPEVNKTVKMQLVGLLKNCTALSRLFSFTENVTISVIIHFGPCITTMRLFSYNKIPWIVLLLLSHSNLPSDQILKIYILLHNTLGTNNMDKNLGLFRIVKRSTRSTSLSKIDGGIKKKNLLKKHNICIHSWRVCSTTYKWRFVYTKADTNQKKSK